MLTHQEQLGWLVDVYNANVWPEAVSNRTLTRGEAGLRPDVVAWIGEANCATRIYSPFEVCFDSLSEATYFMLRYC